MKSLQYIHIVRSGIAQLVERLTLIRKYPRSIAGEGDEVRKNKKYSIFYWEYFWAILTQVRIEHDLPLPMILMGEPLENYVKSLDCRCELASEARTKTGNELLLLVMLIRIIMLIRFFRFITWTGDYHKLFQLIQMRNTTVVHRSGPFTWT